MKHLNKLLAITVIALGMTALRGECMAPEVLDGDYTYVANETLMEMIKGDWMSSDRKYTLTIKEDDTMVLLAKGTEVLSTPFGYTYLQPGKPRATDLHPETEKLTRPEGMELPDSINIMYWDPEDGPKIIVKFTGQEGQVIFQKKDS